MNETLDDIMQGLTVGGGILSTIHFTDIINVYITFLTIICGTSSVIRLIIKLIRRYKK